MPAGGAPVGAPAATGVVAAHGAGFAAGGVARVCRSGTSRVPFEDLVLDVGLLPWRRAWRRGGAVQGRSRSGKGSAWERSMTAEPKGMERIASGGRIGTLRRLLEVVAPVSIANA